MLSRPTLTCQALSAAMPQPDVMCHCHCTVMVFDSVRTLLVMMRSVMLSASVMMIIVMEIYCIYVYIPG